MRTVTIGWEPGASRFVASGTAQGQRIAIAAPRHDPEAGLGSTGFSPTELLLAGAGACAAWDVVEIMRKQRQDLATLEVRVTGEQAADPPWEYERLTLAFTLVGVGLTQAAAERAVRLSLDRYCSVIATVREVAEIRHEVTIVEPGVREGAPSHAGPDVAETASSTEATDGRE